MRLPLSRRRFIQSVGTSAVLAPFANMLFASRAWAAPAKRVMFVYVPDGCIPDRWHPRGSETNFTLPDMTAPLDVIKNHLVFIDGLTMYAGGATHEGGMAKLLTGVSPQSIDIFLGERLGASTAFRSLQLGVGANFQDGAGSMSYVGPNQPVAADDDPLNVFSRIFGGAAGGTEAPDNRKRQSILDSAMGDLRSLQRRLGNTEREKLELHLDSLREVERRLTAVPPASAACDPSTLNRRGFANDPSDYYPLTYHREEHFRTVGMLQMDQAVLALACGVTNVVSLMWSHAVSPTRIRETGVAVGNHDASHFGPPDSALANDFTTLKRWFMERFVYLIQRMDATPDTDGTLLDNTLVVLCSELGDGNLHDHNRMPFVLAGRAGGALRTGRFLDCRGRNGGQNEPHTKLLVSVARAVGVDIDSFGYSGHGTGVLPGL